MPEVVTLAASDRLQVSFERIGDRWAHRIEARSQFGDLTLFRSVEGTSTDDWPASPPFQSINVQKLPDGREAAFLLGMAGTGHWSAAVEVRPDVGEIAFDVACRTITTPDRLGSEYSVASENYFDARHFRALPLRDDYRPTVVREGASKTMRIEPWPEKAPCTIRWQYLVTADV